MSTASVAWPVQHFQSEFLRPQSATEAGVTDRQDRLPGYDSARLQRATVLIIGAGGLGAQISMSLARKGIGRLILADDDVVELSNLNRTPFRSGDLYTSKAHALARIVSQENFTGMQVIGHDVGFNEESALVLSTGVNLGICAVDNNYTRALASRYLGRLGVPIIFVALNEEANHCWCFIQRRLRPCVACVFPRMATSLFQREPCRTVPAAIDGVKVAGGLVGYAVDTVLMKRPSIWTYYDVNLVGNTANVVDCPRARPGCPNCRLAERELEP